VRARRKLVSESVEELRYPTEYLPPQLPPNIPAEQPPGIPQGLAQLCCNLGGNSIAVAGKSPGVSTSPRLSAVSKGWLGVMPTSGQA